MARSLGILTADSNKAEHARAARMTETVHFKLEVYDKEPAAMSYHGEQGRSADSRHQVRRWDEHGCTQRCIAISSGPSSVSTQSRMPARDHGRSHLRSHRARTCREGIGCTASRRRCCSCPRCTRRRRRSPPTSRPRRCRRCRQGTARTRTAAPRLQQLWSRCRRGTARKRRTPRLRR